jgi:hypothetical protein
VTAATPLDPPPRRPLTNFPFLHPQPSWVITQPPSKSRLVPYPLRHPKVLPNGAPLFPRPDFYAGALLNFSENLLYPANAEVVDSDVAIITATEDERSLRETTWAELRELVRRCTNQLRAAGVKEHSVIAGFVANHVEALVAILSSAALGAIWTGKFDSSLEDAF